MNEEQKIIDDAKPEGMELNHWSTICKLKEFIYKMNLMSTHEFLAVWDTCVVPEETAKAYALLETVLLNAGRIPCE